MARAYDENLSISTPSLDSELELVTSSSQNHAVFTLARGQQLHLGSEAAVAPVVSPVQEVPRLFSGGDRRLLVRTALQPDFGCCL